MVTEGVSRLTDGSKVQLIDNKPEKTQDPANNKPAADAPKADTTEKSK